MKMMRKGGLSFRYNAEKVIGIWSMVFFLASQCNAFSLTTWTIGQRFAVRKDVHTHREHGNSLVSVVLASNGDDMDNVNNIGDDEIFASLNSRSSDVDEEKKIMEELSWRTKKIALEEANTRSFLKSKPWKLPYEESSKWVQANLGPDTKEEFFDLVANGNLRTPYIPKQPDKYYKERGTWVSWDHFLNGGFEKLKHGDDDPAIEKDN